MLKLLHSPEQVTQAMEAVPSSETREHMSTTWCINPKEDHQLISNHCENINTLMNKVCCLKLISD